MLRNDPISMHVGIALKWLINQKNGSLNHPWTLHDPIYAESELDVWLKIHKKSIAISTQKPNAKIAPEDIADFDY